MQNEIKKAVYQLVQTGARFRAQGRWFEIVLGYGAIAAIKFYRLTLSRYVGRDCLFHPTCSVYAENAFRSLGWNGGILATQIRLNDCAGSYSLQVGPDGSTKIRTASGTVVDAASLSQTTKQKIETVRTFVERLTAEDR
ncbi:MAG: hypothetical protein CVT73_21485 [Alphaproteobacteria bacterium HGW-Alphaproteobacteria-12]|nr:MAG: hypothetical protein CVT73_21485 [Alphaproteobacteria bacterium HGW-Alphaproteobacteria-12]